MVGKSVGHYKILRQLGSGGMGDVYAAEDTKLSRQVALKVLPPEMASDPERRKRFEREAKAIAALDHPNIVTIHSLEEADDVHFITMQLVEGSTFAEILEGEHLTLERVFELACPLAQAVSVAHERGITHRDLKPANVMVADDGRVMVLDFGLARLREEAVAEEGDTRLPTGMLTDEGKVMGTATYMSPEQAEGKPVDQRTDIFSLGTMLYEMCTGDRPFKGDTPVSIITSIIRDTPPPVTEIDDTLPRHLGRIIKHCLEKDPERRFQSAKDLRNELEELREELHSGEVVATEPESGVVAQGVEIVGEASRHTRLARAPSRPFLRKKWLAALVASVVAFLLAGYFLAQRTAGRRLQELTARLDPLVEADRLDDLFVELHAAGVDLRNPNLESLAAEVAGMLSIVTDPPGATVSLTRVQPIAEFSSREPITLEAPLKQRPLVAGEYLARLARDGMNPIAFLVQLEVGKEVRIDRLFVEAGGDRDGMVLVDEGVGPTTNGDVVPAFLIDRYEVTNAQYLEFVNAGGYRDLAIWPEALLVDGQLQPWQSAMQAFVDRTGLPGPRFWAGGKFPEGEGDHPVVGVSWYEAAAFAEWAGKELPTRHQWWRAALGDSGAAFPWGNDVMTFDVRANFGLASPTVVGAHPLGVSSLGCFDMAGNVREWLRGSGEGSARRTTAGGSWQDPTYMFDPTNEESFEPSYANEAIGLRLAMLSPGRSRSAGELP